MASNWIKISYHSRTDLEAFNESCYNVDIIKSQNPSGGGGGNCKLNF